MTLDLGSVECIVDATAQVAIVDERGRIVRGGQQMDERGVDGRVKSPMKSPHKQGRHDHGPVALEEQIPDALDWKIVWNEGTDAVMDVPIGGVCEILYGSEREGDD